MVTYNGIYVRINRENLDLSLISPIVLSLGCLACLLAPAFLSAVRRIDQETSKSRARIAAWIWLVSFALLTAAQGRIAPHYFILAVPPLTILGARVFDQARQRAGSPGQRLTLAVVLVGFLITAVVASFTTVRYFTRFPNRDQLGTVAAWIRTNTAEGQTIFAWGNQPYLYDAADRRPASKYVHMLPLTTPGYSSPEQVAELVSRFEAKPPEAFVDAGSSAPGEPGWLPLLIPRTVLRVDGRELDLLDPLRAFVRENYHLAEIVDGWPVYLHD